MKERGGCSPPPAHPRTARRAGPQRERNEKSERWGVVWVREVVRWGHATPPYGPAVPGGVPCPPHPPLSTPPDCYQRLEFFIQVLRVLCPNLTDASLGNGGRNGWVAGDRRRRPVRGTRHPLPHHSSPPSLRYATRGPLGGGRSAVGTTAARPGLPPPDPQGPRVPHEDNG